MKCSTLSSKTYQSRKRKDCQWVKNTHKVNGNNAVHVFISNHLVRQNRSEAIQVNSCQKITDHFLQLIQNRVLSNVKRE